MSSHRVVWHFRTGAFDIRAEALGRTWRFRREGRELALSLPSAPDSFGSYVDALSVTSWESGEREDALKEGRAIVAAVTVIEVSIDVDVAISSPEPSSKEIKLGQETVHAAFPVALSVVSDLISWLRVDTGRYWLASSHEAPEVLRGDLVESDSGRRVRNIGFIPALHVTGFGFDGLSSAELDHIAARIRGRDVPETAELLLADARETLIGPSVEADWQTTRRDIRRAILLAAIASEVKIKSVLREKTSPEKRDLVEIVLKNLREVQVAVGQLPHETMKAAIGRSLHEEAEALFRDVNKLFHHRNNIAHRGEPPSLDEARQDLQAAIDLFSWLDSLPGPGDRRTT